jgi:hypothetical protein
MQDALLRDAGCRTPCYGLQDAGRFATGGRMQDAGCRMPCNGGGATDTSPEARDAQDPKR